MHGLTPASSHAQRKADYKSQDRTREVPLIVSVPASAGESLQFIFKWPEFGLWIDCSGSLSSASRLKGSHGLCVDTLVMWPVIQSGESWNSSVRRLSFPCCDLQRTDEFSPSTHSFMDHLQHGGYSLTFGLMPWRNKVDWVFWAV